MPKASFVAVDGDLGMPSPYMVFGISNDLGLKNVIGQVRIVFKRADADQADFSHK